MNRIDTMGHTAATTRPVTPERVWSWWPVWWLYAIQAVNLALPLAALPVATRVLGPEGWAKVAVAQSFGLVLGLLVEFGFNYSGARDVAQNEGNSRARDSAVRNVLGAQLLLAALAVTLACFFRRWLPVVFADDHFFWGAVLWMIPQAAGLQWYFQATGALLWFSSLTAVSRGLALVLLLATVHSPEDAAWALVVQAIAGLAVTCPAWVWVLRSSPHGRMSRRGVLEAIWNGRSLFAYRIGVYLYAVVNTLALGWIGTGSQVGAYAFAERIAKAMTGLLDPISLTLFPHLVQARQSDFGRWAAWVTCLAGLGIGFAMWCLTPSLIPFLSGSDWSASIEAGKVLALFPVGAALGQAFGIQRLIPAGRDGVVACVAAIAAACHGLGLWWVVRSEGTGTAHIHLAWLAVGIQFLQFALFASFRVKGKES